MATIGEVGAEMKDTISSGESRKIPLKLYFGVFFDGTGNNMIPSEIAKERRKTVKRLTGIDDDWDLYINPDLKNGANEIKAKSVKDNNGFSAVHVGTGHSNVAILHSCYQGMSATERKKEEKNSCLHIYNIYIEGAGKEAVNDDSFVQDAENVLGSGMGNGKTGVAALVSKAIRMVRIIVDGFSEYINNENTSSEIHFDVFGFSRGAACARLFSYVAGRDGKHKLGSEKKFSKFQAGVYFKEGYMHFLDKFKLTHDVTFLGIFDTVSSIGLTYDDNVADYGLFSPEEEWVKETMHICAMDEFRDHFALTDINISKEGNIEVFIPGCHSDVGGGYQIGSESFLLTYRRNLLSRNRMYTDFPNSSSKGVIEDISPDCLQKLGWGIGDEMEENTLNGTIECNRERILAGYSNIPLSLMKDRANKSKVNKSKCRFAEFPKGRFVVPKGLKKINELCKSEVDKISCGRKWIFPGGSYSSDEYRNLRHRYLHFSATDELLSKHNSIVHSPNIKDGTICRIVYRGQKNALSNPLYIYDYE